ncbi:helix-turn-helix transcriptional regulator [Actinosynnema pretiosum subsp. pretiosum]
MVTRMLHTVPGVSDVRSEAVGKEPSPVLYKAELGRAMRRAREAAGLTRDAVADKLGCSLSKITTIELGKVAVRRLDLPVLLDLYGLEGQERSDLEHLAESARQRNTHAPWAAVIPERLRRFFATEETSDVITTYQPGLLHGLVQTESYARAVIISSNPSLTPLEVEQIVQSRLARQALLTGDSPPKITLVIDEHVLRIPVGGRKVMREQLNHLAAQAAAGLVHLRVIPTAIGAHPGLGVPPFMLLTPTGSDSPTCYIETFADGIFVDGPDRLSQYQNLLTEMQLVALSEEESLSLVAIVAEQL